jgi:hypothetical protein
MTASGERDENRYQGKLWAHQLVMVQATCSPQVVD